MTLPAPEIQVVREQLFRPVLEWLEAGAPHVRSKIGNIGFNMVGVQDRGLTDYIGRDCGKACCIAGAAQAFRSDSYMGTHGLAVEAGMTQGEKFNLFFSDNGPPMEKITPAMAAKTLRGFLETGEIVWGDVE